jgi:hypothetical protein
MRPPKSASAISGLSNMTNPRNPRQLIARFGLVLALACNLARGAEPPTPATSTVAPTPAAVAPAAEAASATATEAAPAAAPAAPGADSTRALDEQVQDLKKSVVDLNRDLFVLEEELLFPANTQVAVFVSMDVGAFFALDSVTLRIDNREVSNYLYTPREVAALVKGGVQRLYVGNLRAGTHELVALFSGKGPNERDYRRGASVKFEKGVGAKYLELKISDRVRSQQPEFEIRDWE